MVVLSLFDGMSCGRIALDRAGLVVTKYFASELDKHAIKVSRDNWPDIIQIGDVTKVSYAAGVLYTENGNFEVPKIDLLIGGSPCQGFSTSGKSLNFEDPRSKLFFEYVRLLEETNADFFLLENVVMKKEYENIITEMLYTKPVKINSALVSAQNRNRLYWANWEFQQPKEKGILLKDIVGFSSSIPEITQVLKEIKKFTKRNFLINISETGNIRPYQLDLKKSGLSELGTIVNPNNKSFSVIATHAPKTYKIPFEIYELNRNECEALQTLPFNYTKSVSETQAKKMLGNGWTVDVIAHILSFLPNIYNKYDIKENYINTFAL